LLHKLVTGVLIKEIKRAQTSKELKQIRVRLTDLIQTSIYKNIPLTYISNITSEINFALLKRAIELSILALGSPPPARPAKLVARRKEQLLLIKTAFCFEDVATDKYREVKDYFLSLKKTSLTLQK
jgi:CBS domain-containing protein